MSFISLVLLIKSLTLQIQANAELKLQSEESKKTEKIRSFEARMFSMIDSQKQAFSSLTLNIKVKRKNTVSNGNDAIIIIETEIERLRKSNKSDDDIVKFLKQVDAKDQIFSATRIFYIMVKLVSECLSDENGFNESDRRSHFLTLINFTEFSLLRLIMISVQFLDYHSTDYLKSNNEFTSVLEGVGLGYNLY